MNNTRCKLAWLILGLFAFASGARAQVNLQGWTFRVAGQTVQVTSDGSVIIPNISAPDQFGPGGPGTRPDFVSDDFVRVVGKSNDEGVPIYAFSEFFRVAQGQTYTIKNWTFTSVPPPAPIALRMAIDKPALTKLDETAQVTVTGILADGSEIDLTKKESWTTYRISNPEVASVDESGKISAKSSGVAFVTAINEGATGVLQVDVVLGGDLTTIRGVAFTPAGAPVAGLSAFLIGAGGTAVTGPDGVFTIAGVTADRRISGIIVRGSTPGGAVFGKSGPLSTVAGGLTDAGILTVRTCAELGIDCTDTDNDCIPDSVERAMRLNPASPDSDGDGVPDGEEDTDGDGFSNCTEILQGTDPGRADSDGDGLSDRDEIYRFRTDPSDADTDRDGLSDGAEIARGSDPFNPDTDGDGLDDGTEVLEGMDPLTADPPLIRQVASAPVSFLHVVYETVPREVEISVRSAPVSFMNAQMGHQPGSLLLSVASAPATYLHAVLGAPTPNQFVVSPVVTYRKSGASALNDTPTTTSETALSPSPKQ